ncbi:uncharacterized protein LOC111910089 [Lactuca sativa]|uniref:VWFA domain-containing protein n=1 Tax=Lactuca sativa TaxID=4236 RepID=A0A9R1XBU4_LACSA|nr:uncharacterized protein LOC111910089 [Lactuca sativa]KAJ0202697.1 hypothetical protein LSAT_V11C500277920 [Lactuca sativa]
MTTEFSKSVDTGIRLSKRIYYGKEYEPRMSAPKPAIRTKSPSPSPCSSPLPTKHHPTAPMVYAMITEPDIVDNPDIRSYQPHVYGRCNPPALIPLHMYEISMNMECYLDIAFVTVSGTWHVHCVTASACCDCCIAIPMGEQGSILDIKVESTKRSYFTKLIAHGGEKDSDRITKAKDGFLMKRNTYTLRIPQVDGGSIIHVKVRWSQKLVYQDNEFFLSIPFTFPSYVLPLKNKIPQMEKLLVNVNSGTGTEITCTSTSHPLKEVQRKPAGEASFSYEAEVPKWSTQDFYFAYYVCSNEIFGGLLLHRPSLHDYDRRDMFCFYLFPGANIIRKHFRREVVFLLDKSGSMRGDPFEKSKHAIITSLLKLNQQDLFNIIAFNEGIQSFSSSLELATKETIRNATEWMWKTLVAEGDTNLMCPLKQALEMVGKNGELIPLIFLITDGTIEDEREICNMMKFSHVDGCLSSPRIFTFGIGSYCNHHFLPMLAHIGRGYYDHAYDVDLIGDRLQRLFNNALSPLLTNVTLDSLETLKSYELYPSRIPDLLPRSPLIISGRYQGKFPELVKVRGLMTDLSSYVMDIKVRKTSNINLDRMCGMREVDILTSQAWLDQNIDMEKKVAKMSLQRGVPSEYTRVILVHKDKVKPATLQSLLLDKKCSRLGNEKVIYLRNPCVGFGNLKATAANLPPGMEDIKLNEATKMVVEAATSRWGMFINSWCWRCVKKMWSQLKSEHCTLAIAQICTALTCLECLDCCCDMCDLCSAL